MIPPPLRDAIHALSRLPGIGPKSAERLALALLKRPKEDVHDLLRPLSALHDSLQSCEICGLICERDICSICTDSSREESVIAVVETSLDAFSLERSGFHGRYHVLNGTLSPLEGRGPRDLTIDLLEKRLDGTVTELILALNPSLEGEATSAYLVRLFQGKHVTCSRLARGLPMGSALEYIDDVTLHQALSERRLIEQRP